MSNAAIYIKTEAEVKVKAQKVARDLGFSLSSLMNDWLRQLIRTKTVNFSVADEEPSDYLLRVMDNADKNRQAGKGSRVFEDADSLLYSHRDSRAVV